MRKKTLEDNQYNLRRVVDIPGTGPFKSKRRVENEVWVMEKNTELLEQGGRPALSRRHRVLSRPAIFARAWLERCCPTASTTGRMRRSGDRCASAKATPGHVGRPTFTRASSRRTWVNNKKKPLDDPRVRRAIHLVLRQAGTDRRRERRGADDGRRIHLSVFRASPRRRTELSQARWLTSPIRRPRSRKRRR